MLSDCNAVTTHFLIDLNSMIEAHLGTTKHLRVGLTKRLLMELHDAASQRDSGGRLFFSDMLNKREQNQSFLSRKSPFLQLARLAWRLTKDPSHSLQMSSMGSVNSAQNAHTKSGVWCGNTIGLPGAESGT